MSDPTKEQIEQAQAFLSAMLKDIGISVRYSDDHRGLKDGFYFIRTGTTEQLVQSDFKSMIKAQIEYLNETASNHNFNELNVERLQSLSTAVSGGDKGLFGLFQKNYAVVANNQIASEEFQVLLNDFNHGTPEKEIDKERKETLIEGEGYEWKNYIDITNSFEHSKSRPLSFEEQVQSAKALNWLEDYIPEFKTLLTDLKSAQESGVINGKVELGSTNDDPDYIRSENQIIMNFKESIFYLGTDGKIYQGSLNEVLMHELQHAAQRTLPQFRNSAILDDHNYQKGKIVKQALDDYLASKGVSELGEQEDYYRYIFDVSYRTKDNIDQAIVDEAQFQELASQWFVIHLVDIQSSYPLEDNAMDKSNILREIVGKPTRGHYAGYYIASHLVGNEMVKGGYEPLIYDRPPEVIMQGGHKAWDVPDHTSKSSLLTDNIYSLYGSIENMQSGWNDRFNRDTKNITSEEWRVIQATKADLWEGKTVASLSASDKAKVDNLVDNLKRSFNKTSGNDALNTEEIRRLSENGVDSLPQNIKKSVWELE